jgi:hypothetical protein
MNTTAALEPTEARGSGRTYRALEQTPDGGVYVVHSMCFAPYIQDQLVKQGRRHDAVRIIPAGDPYLLQGQRGPVLIDHFVFDDAFERRKDLSELLSIATHINERSATH